MNKDFKLEEERGKLTIQVLETRLTTIPKQGKINQFLRIFHGDEQEYESDPQWDTGLIAQFSDVKYVIGTNLQREQPVIDFYNQESL